MSSHSTLDSLPPYTALLASDWPVPAEGSDSNTITPASSPSILDCTTKQSLHDTIKTYSNIVASSNEPRQALLVPPSSSLSKKSPLPPFPLLPPSHPTNLTRQNVPYLSNARRLLLCSDNSSTPTFTLYDDGLDFLPNLSTPSPRPVFFFPAPLPRRRSSRITLSISVKFKRRRRFWIQGEGSNSLFAIPIPSNLTTSSTRER